MAQDTRLSTVGWEFDSPQVRMVNPPNRIDIRKDEIRPIGELAYHTILSILGTRSVTGMGR